MSLTVPLEDTLKGITAADLMELQAAHDAYIVDKDTAQTATGNAAGTLRQQVESLFD